jgi:hypothetical protein
MCFLSSAGTWSQQKLDDPEPVALQAFGVSVSVSGDTVVVGADGDDQRGAEAGADVEGSNPFSRSRKRPLTRLFL